jgi:beta-galactosidase
MRRGEMITPKVPKIIYGGDYFPEQWPEEIWREDVRLMKKANVNMVSIAIFTWALLQPDEETYNFDWLDKVMNLLAENDIYACLATSTAAPPIWLSSKYDDVLPVNESGVKIDYGSRQAYCINSPTYRKFIRKLAGKIAERYKDHKALALWHINNEYANKNQWCFCKNCKKDFQTWLQKKYGTIEKLNEVWGTVFWGEKYFDWQQVNTPIASSGSRNSSKLLDYKRFLSESFYTLYREEYDVLRKITPDIPITTNFEGDWRKFDHSLFKDSLDVVSWNCYPDPANADSRKWAALRHSMMRSLLGKPFMLMEQAPSQVDWYPVNINKPPGLMRLWSYQALAHGSDSLMFFQWRASRKGAERYHSGMIPHFGTDSRVFGEICDLGSELEKVKEVIGSQIESQVAILMDNDSWWTVDNPYGPAGSKSLDNETFWNANAQPFPTVLVSYFGELEYYFNMLYEMNISVDVIPVHYDFSKYKIVIAPLLHLIKPGFKEAAENFVKNGGIFITTYFTGLIDESVGVFLGGYPGPLKGLMGIRVEEYNPLPPGGKNIMNMMAVEGFQKQYDCSVWSDVIHPMTAKVLATFVNDYYAGCPAVTENHFGKGKAFYIGTRPDKNFMTDLFTKILSEKQIEIPILQDEMEFTTRKNGQDEYYFYLNHGDSKKTVKLPQGKYKDMLSGKIFEDTLNLNKYGVYILKKNV